MKIDHSEKAVWGMFSKFIRARDADWRGYVRCISCGCIKKWNRGIDAGHYIARGNDNALKYNEINVNGQCSEYCNRRLSGNLIMYRIGLVRKVGEEKVKLLEESHFFKTTKKNLNQLERNAAYDFYKKEFEKLNKEKCLD
jgi:hypothetical protein